MDDLTAKILDALRQIREEQTTQKTEAQRTAEAIMNLHEDLKLIRRRMAEMGMKP